MARRDTSPRPMLRPEGFGAAEQTERMLQPEGDPLVPTEVMKTGITEKVMDKAQEYVDNPPPIKKQSPVQKAIDKSLIGGAEEDYEVKISKVTPEGRSAIRNMISRVLGRQFNGDLDAFYYCTTFVSDMLDSIGADPLNTKGDPYNRTRANAYMKYGTPVDLEDIQEGDIVIFDFPKLPDGTLTLDPTRGKRNGLGDHATFYAGDRLDVNKPGSNYIGVLGGEQGGGAAISMKAFDKSHILGVRRIQYDDIDYEFTKELSKANPDFNKFLNDEAKAFDFNAFIEEYSNPVQGSNRLTPSFDEGGLAEPKGLSWGELIVDNILGLDNEYESFGEKLGKAINEDEIKFLKDAAIGVYEGTKEFVQAPVETTKEVVNQIKDSVTRLGSEDLNTRLQNMYGVSYEQATDEQVNQAREAVLGDALTALELIPAAKGATTVAKAGIAAVPGGLKADVIGQTKAMLSGDTEFLKGTPSNRASTQSLSAGFTGQNPPTYIPKDEPPFDPDGIYETKDDIVRFREPIAEFTRKLTMANSFPSKGMTGAEFLRLLEKNAESIPPSSYKEGLVDKDKRYTREQLLDAVTKSPAGLPESIYYNLADLAASPAFGGYQRQTQVGFTGYPRYPEDTSYFSIPILSRTSGNTFKANSQHFDASTTAHVRGSFIDPLVGFEVNKTLSPEFKSIVGKDRPYLLVEEIQSDLLQKGYRKPKNSFDSAFNMAADEAMAGSPVTFQEVYGDLTNELKSLIKTLDSEGVVMPEEPVRLQLPFRTGALNHPQYKDRRRRDFIDELYSPERGTVEDSRLVEFEEIKDYIDKQGVNSSHIHQILNDLREGANRTRSINNFEDVSFVGPNNKVYDSIIVRSQDSLSNNPMYIVDVDSPAYDEFLKDFDEYTKQFGLNYDDLADAYDEELDKYYAVIDKEITDRKLDKDEVDGAFINGLYERFLQIKKDQRLLGDETNTALPPVRKNKQTVEEALKLLIAKADQEGVNKIVIPPASKIAEARGRTIDPSDKGDRFYRTYVADLNKALEDLEKNYPVTIHRDIELPYKNENQPTRTAAEQHLIDMGFEDMVNDNPNAVAANAADDAAINDDDLFTVEEGNEFFALPEGFFDDVPDQDVPVQEPKAKTKSDNHKGIIIDISKLREQFQVDKPRQFAKGGAVNNMSMKQQMSLFEYGGIADDGMTKDPVSGNNIPPGSLAKEVRDDIPAMLSEGEYVVPADVLRFYGVNFFENLRNQAKSGLQNMEQNGRIGGTPMTQQDVARNMQQPMMAPAPVQAAQGAMMQSPMRIQQQPAPQAMGNAMPQQQPIMANQGVMVQGFNQGPMPTASQYRSSWTPARARYSSPMFQGTSSQQANVAAAAEAGATAGEEITQLRTHYNQKGETAQVEYVGTDPSNMSIKQTEANLAIVAAYPLTEQEYKALVAEINRGSGSGSGGGDGDRDPTPTGSSTSWMDGIDYTNQAEVEKWAENAIGLSKEEKFGQKYGGALFGGASALSQAQDIAQVRGMAQIQRAAGNKDLAETLEKMAQEAVDKGPVALAAFDALGFMTGDQYAKAGLDLVGTTIGMQAAMRGAGTDSPTMTSPGLSGDTAESRAEIAKEQEVMSQQVGSQGSGSSGDDSYTGPDGKEYSSFSAYVAADSAKKAAEAENTTGFQDIMNMSPEETGLSGGNVGGLMTAPKPKKKTRKYNKGGLAGKKK